MDGVPLPIHRWVVWHATRPPETRLRRRFAPTARQACLTCRPSPPCGGNPDESVTFHPFCRFAQNGRNLGAGHRSALLSRRQTWSRCRATSPRLPPLRLREGRPTKPRCPSFFGALRIQKNGGPGVTSRKGNTADPGRFDAGRNDGSSVCSSRRKLSRRDGRPSFGRRQPINLTQRTGQ